MAPELILTGHCSKATDVFAVGVVLFILLCGRPPFNSKSNREVLEKTARGQYSMVGAEWDDISAEAKDLVTRMLKVNPDERISTTDILNHPWIKHLDEEPDDLSSTSSASNDVVTGVVKSPGSFSGSQRSVNRKGTGMNLANALRHLSGHVKQLRSEKFASNVTKLVSLMQQNGQNKSTLTKLYLVPMHNNSTPAPPTDPNHPNQPPRDEDQGAESIIKESEMNEEEYETWFLSPDFREGFSAAIRNFSDDDSGRLSIEQFMSLLKYVHTNSTGISTNNQGLAPLIIGKFIDRDNDGYITPDDIFAAQALIMQRSEIFLKVVFRIYAESIWYPGRQLNLRSLMSQANMKGNNDNVGSMTPGGSKVLTNDNMLPSVVEPPKFITARHIAAVFEKLGYEPALGQKAFTILCEGLSRIKTDHNERIDECDEREASPERVSTAPINSPNAALARAFEDMDDTETPRKNGKFGTPDEVSTKAGGTNRDSTSNLRQSDASEKVGNNQPPLNSPTAAAAGSARMDLQDFVRAAELDDILIQVSFLFNC
jgi:serine/threonine protein kinase